MLERIMTTTILKRAFCVSIFLMSLQISAQKVTNQTAFCNPLNLDYRFQPDLPSRREAADPSMVLYKGKYYLFASKSGGYWTSDNLLNWSFITSPDLPLEDYAPTALVMNDAIYFMALDRRIYKSSDPMSGCWQIVKEALDIYAGDPCLFLDDDGRLYLYHGLTNSKPIRGIELDKNTFNPIGEEKNLMNTDPKLHGWERTGNYNTEQKRPFLEGAWMTKHNGKYYLQYAAPGTQYKSYSDGLYIGEQPLGPFKLADNNPFSYKPEGFVCSAGHSSTFQDKYGNYWHAVTMLVGLKHRFERRIGLFPAFFDKDDTFYTYTGFGDFPHTIPNKKMNGPEDYQPSAMLLSYNKPIEVSSELEGHSKELANNENIQDYWSAQTGDKGEWLMMDLQNKCKVGSIQINYYDEGTTNTGRSASIYHQYLLEYSNDKISWKILADKTRNTSDVPHDYVELQSPVSARYIRLTNYHVPDGKFAISDFRVFGKGNAKKAEPVATITAVRDVSDACNVALDWPKNAKATGYNIRYGTAPDKLCLNYQVLEANTLTIHSLDALQDYYFTIDTFNETGITKGKIVVKVPTTKKN
ncbi:family 43 glycosylhydrolase [Flavobacterium limnophilum]|uniref:family 43 glycosylhydrolase n=1 Tax=Flavobacterium limnophilum TaxID=3003262 RepID=UPI002482C5CD|nr:family 43 glycosylhydrolase [Flavobacterium limnophilum]